MTVLMNFLAVSPQPQVDEMTPWRWPQENGLIVSMTAREGYWKLKEFKSCKQVQHDTHFPICLCCEVSVVSKGWLLHMNTSSLWVTQHANEG